MPSANDAPPFAAPLTVDPIEPAPLSQPDKPGIFENSAVNVVGLAAASGFGVLSGLITARVLGDVGVGILAVAFGLVEFGRGLTNFTHGPSILEVHRGKPSGAVWGTSLALKLAGSALFVALIVALAPKLSTMFNVPEGAIILTSTVLVAGAFAEIGAARWEAENRMIQRNLLVALGPFVAFVAVLAFVLLDVYSIHTAILASIMGTAVMSLGFVAAWGRLRAMRFDLGIASYLARYGSRLLATAFLTQALIWTDTLMISAMLGNAAAGVYNVVFQLTFIMVTASTAIGVAVLPAMSELRGRGQDTSAAYQRATLLALALSIVVTIGYLVAGRFILSIYGSEFVRGYPALLVLVLFGISAAAAVPATSMLTVHNRAGALTLLSLAMALVNIPLNYVLIASYGIFGAAVATTSVFALGTLATWILVHRVAGAWPVSLFAIHEAAGMPRRLMAKLR